MDSNYHYENKFFPQRNIPLKLKNVQNLSRKVNKRQNHFAAKNNLINKENADNNINEASFPNSITGSVPSRLSSKMASNSFVKNSPSKNIYFSPNWKYTPYQNRQINVPPVYKRSVLNRRNKPSQGKLI